MTDTENSWGLPQRQKILMIAALLTGAFMGITNETLLATALPSIQEAFGITTSEVQWMTTAFLMTNGIMIPVSAFLIDRFSTRGLFLTAIGLFGAGTAIAAIAPVYPMLLLGRVVQASGSGIMLPLLMTVLLAIGTAILVTLVAMGAQSYVPGPDAPAGQVEQLAEITGYHWAFMGGTVLALLAFVLSFFLRPPKKEKEIVAQIHGEAARSGTH